LLQDIEQTMAGHESGGLTANTFETITFDELCQRFDLVHGPPYRVLNRTAVFLTNAGKFIAVKAQKRLSAKTVEEIKFDKDYLTIDEAKPEELGLMPAPGAANGGYEPEPAMELLREHVVLSALNKHQTSLGLESRLPRPQGVFIIKSFPVDCFPND